MDKLTKVKAEIGRLKEIAEYNLSHSKMDRSAWMQQASVCTNLLSFIDSIQKEPKSFDEAIQEGDDVRYNEDLGCRVNLSRLKRVAKKEATGKLKECIDNITEESLAKARKQLQEESQVCMYSTANYTDEDRKVLCEGCEDECRFNKKDEIKSVHAQHTTISSSLNDYLCKAYNALYKGNGGILSFARLQNMAIDITEWQKEQMMAKAVDAQCFGFQGAALFSFRLPAKDYLVGSNVKVIVIKED